MTRCLLLIATCVLSFASHALAQTAKVEGTVVDDKGKAVAGVRMTAPGGQAQETDSRGHFSIQFPAAVQPGQATRIEVAMAGWVIFEPMLGNCVTQSAERNFEPLKVVIVPRSSLLALAPERLSQVIARWAIERAQLSRRTADQGRQLDEYAFLREYAEKYGFTLDQFKQAADEWARRKDSNDKEELALKQYWLKDYASVAKLAHEAALGADEELERANKDRLEAGRKVVRRFWLEGIALHSGLKFRDALNAYAEIEKRFQSRKLDESDLVEEWAGTKLLIGMARTELSSRVEGAESRSLLTGAVTAYREALTAKVHKPQPYIWAATQNDLGLTLKALGEVSSSEESLRYFDEGIATLNEALKVYTRDESPVNWAMTQMNLASLLRTKGGLLTGDASARLIAASISACREALKVNTLQYLPEAWAMTQINLASALTLQGQRSSGEESARLFAEAGAAFRESLRVFTRDASPQQWAIIQNNLGIALRGLAEVSTEEIRLRLLGEAIAAYRDALKVYTRENAPRAWASTKNNLGAAQLSLAEHSGGVESSRQLTEAIANYGEALTVRTREHMPQDWMATQNNLGMALRAQGKRASGAESIRLLTESRDAFRGALAVTERQNSPQAWATLQNNLGVTLGLMGARTRGQESVRFLAEAVTAYRAALTIRTREQHGLDWAATQDNLANALILQGLSSNFEERKRLLSEGISASGEALKFYTRDAMPEEWAAMQISAGRAHFALKQWPDAVRCLEGARTVKPGNRESYQYLQTMYHEELFLYEKAFKLHQAWLSMNPNDASVLPDFAETHFTTGRFTEFQQRSKAVLDDPKVVPNTKVALQMVGIANLIALENTALVPEALTLLARTIAEQKPDFHIDWSFAGSIHFINKESGQETKFAKYRDWLNQLFATAQKENRDAMVAALKVVQAQSIR